MSLDILWHHIDRSALEKPGWKYQHHLFVWPATSSVPQSHTFGTTALCVTHTPQVESLPLLTVLILLDILALIKPARWLLTLALSGLGFKQGTFTSAILFILLRPQKKESLDESTPMPLLKKILQLKKKKMAFFWPCGMLCHVTFHHWTGQCFNFEKAEL